MFSFSEPDIPYWNSMFTFSCFYSGCRKNHSKPLFHPGILQQCPVSHMSIYLQKAYNKTIPPQTDFQLKIMIQNNKSIGISEFQTEKSAILLLLQQLRMDKRENPNVLY